jgi:5'-nucleotidase
MRNLVALAAVTLGLLVAAPTGFAAGSDNGKDKNKDTHVQLLAINDFHGNLQANTPGTLTYCCEMDTNPAVNKPVAVRRNTGGIEYLGTLVKNLRDRNSNTITVGAGDMIGASPLISGLFHDEPTVESLNALGLQVTGVGNHEFDEGLQELYRMQYGGCVASDATTCATGSRFSGADYRYLAANVFFAGTNHTVFPPYKIAKVDNAKIAFIGLTLEGTPLIVTPTAVQGLEFRPEVQTVNALVQHLRAEEGVRTFVVLLHQGGQQNAPFSNAGKYAGFATGFADVNGCDNLNGDIGPIVQGLDPQVDVVVSAHTHQPYVCPNYAGTHIMLTSASSFGRLVTSIELTIDHQTKDVSAVTATNWVVKQTEGPFNSATTPADLGAPVAKDPVESKILAKWSALADPLANRVVGHITADLLSSRDSGGSNFAGEQPIGETIADAQLAATSASDFGSAVVAFMNPGGIRGSLKKLPGPGETRNAGEVTYGNAFAVQPFANVMQVKTLTGQQIVRLLEQQWSGTNTGTNRKTLQVSKGFTYSFDLTAPTAEKVVPGSVKLNGTPLDPLASYRVAMNNFLGGGGDGFGVFTEGTNTLGGEVDLDAFVQYLMANDPVPTPPMDRILRLG